MINILLTGAFGQLGTALRRVFSKNSDFNIILTSLKIPNSESGISLDVRNKVSINEIFKSFDIDIIIHLAALTDVDECEKNPIKAKEININGTKNFCENFDGYFVYISSDYVFDGKNGPYSENNPVRPINIYGATKLEAEKVVLSKSGDNLIIRSNVIYDYNLNSKASFLNWIIESLKNNKKIKVVNDQYNNPTSADSLAIAIYKSIKNKLNGVAHWADKEIVNRYEFSIKIAKVFDLDAGLISPISSDELNQLARRPLNSGLSSGFLSKKINMKPSRLDDSLSIIKKRINR
tara:strand:- start:1160 stop:2035 length:876 start_codon:yes stop_codon:yes gene_type:complete